MESSTGVVLPSTVLEDLKCVNCSLYLSVPPIMYNKEQNLVCGRCKNQENLIARAKAFETVAKLFLFPCRYAGYGCVKNLKLETVEEHEALCDFRYKCPFMDDCDWYGSFSMIPVHLITKHNFFMYDSQFFLNLEGNDQKLNLLYYTCSDVVLFEAVVHVKLGKFRFRIENFVSKHVISSSTTYTGILHLENSDCRKKVIAEYNFTLNWQSLFHKNDMLEIDIASIKTSLNNSMVRCKITLGDAKAEQGNKRKRGALEENQSEVSASSSSNEVTPLVDKVLLSELECPICNEYMISRIFVCNNGHSICEDCERKVTICPNCRVPFGKIRNFSMEKLAACVNYPCRNEIYDCKFIGNSNAIKEHKENCAIFDCLLKEYQPCNWKGLFKNILSHVKENHVGNVSMGETLYHDINAKNCRITSYEEQLFKICYQQNLQKEMVSCVFQQVGLGPTDVSPYKFEIEFLDQTNGGRRFIITALCQGVVDVNEAFKNSLNISRSSLLPFITENKICYQFRIQKN